ncbi:MAG: hypothetical protein Q7T74_06955 [Candidatus Saccharibacteria bacterium]|nr:hypothetical protein [Candidatus Saccharibacteria bacterium]
MNTKLFAISVLTASLLSACGGGGSASSTPPVSQSCTNGATDYPTCTPGVTPESLQTTVPVPSYAQGTEEIVAFDEFNNFRVSMRLGKVAESFPLSTSSKNHAVYVVTYQSFTHTEDPNKLGFTGITPNDRALFAGYSGGNVGEMIGGSGGSIGVRGLMNTLYHRDGITTQQVTDIGISFNPAWSAPLVIENGLGKGQHNASNFLTMYPVDGQVDVPLVMYPETPNPLPDLDLYSADYVTKTSSPVSFYSVAGSTLSVSSFTITENGQSLPLDMRLITFSNDTNKMLQPHVAHLVGKAPFKQNTKYNVSFAGSVNGASVAKTWSFITGTSLNIGGGAKKP